MVSYKRKRIYEGASGPGRAIGKRRITVYRAVPSRVAYGVGRTGGNYNLIARRWDSRMGAYRVGPGPERKFVDTVTGLTVPFQAVGAGVAGESGAASNLVLLNALSQGTDSTSRIGRKVMMKSLLFRGTISLGTTAAGTVPAGCVGGQVRVLCVYDSQANGAAPVATDILANNTIDTVICPMNLNNRERFKIIFDKYLTLDPQGPQSATLKVHRKFNLPIIFNSGNAGTIADIQTGSVYVLAATTVQATAGANLDLNQYTRIRFLDD